jgi:hypothetical protein
MHLINAKEQIYELSSVDQGTREKTYEFAEAKSFIKLAKASVPSRGIAL